MGEDRKDFDKDFDEFVVLNLASSVLGSCFGEIASGKYEEGSGERIAEELAAFNDAFFSKEKICYGNWKSSGGKEVLMDFGRKMSMLYGKVVSPEDRSKFLSAGLERVLKNLNMVYGVEDYGKLDKDKAKYLAKFFGRISELAYVQSQRYLGTDVQSEE